MWHLIYYIVFCSIFLLPFSYEIDDDYTALYKGTPEASV